MTQWVEEKPTMELRWVQKTSPADDAYGLEIGMTLQQLWKIAKGGTGRVYYTEEWRDVPVVHDGVDGDGR